MTEPTHTMRIAAHPRRVRALFEGHEIADSDDVLAVFETGHDRVFYFPREDVDMAALRKNDHVTHCPLKGAATHFTVNRDAKVIENVAWSYEDPFDDAHLIAGRIAFYPEHVEFEEGEIAPIRRVAPHDPPYADTTDVRDV